MTGCRANSAPPSYPRPPYIYFFLSFASFLSFLNLNVVIIKKYFLYLHTKNKNKKGNDKGRIGKYDIKQILSEIYESGIERWN